MEMDFSFSEELYQMIFWPYSHWPANSLTHELHMLKKKTRTTQPQTTDELKTAIKAT